MGPGGYGGVVVSWFSCGVSFLMVMWCCGLAVVFGVDCCASQCPFKNTTGIK